MLSAAKSNLMLQLDAMESERSDSGDHFYAT